MEVKDGVLIKNSSYYKNVSFYLNDNSENCAAFVVWLIRNEYIDKENFVGIKKALFKRQMGEFSKAVNFLLFLGLKVVKFPER